MPAASQTKAGAYGIPAVGTSSRRRRIDYASCAYGRNAVGSCCYKKCGFYAAVRYFSVVDELTKRVKALERMVELYDEANECLSDDDPDERAFGPGLVDSFLGNLKTREYKIVVRSSLAPFATANEVTKQDVIGKRTMEYFQQYGGFENAHKAKWTVVKSMKRK